MSVRVESLKGSTLENAIPDLARLRIEVFRDFPYLYEGSLDYEKNYLQIYVKSKEAVVIAALDGDKIIGAATALPLEDEADYVQKPFRDAQQENKMDISKIFYFGESVLLKNYRGLGIGNSFFDGREKAARIDTKYNITTFCAVQRPEDHPMRPAKYRPLDEFWKKRGYHKEPKLQATFHWKDIGEKEETGKPMIYWLKEWK
jgi:hypothetical protein